MGFTTECVRFLNYCKENGVDFESTLQVARQSCDFSSDKIGVKEGDFAEPLLRFLGAKKVESMDYSDYEQASIIHDMNLPINEDLKESFSAVIEGGTLEHVFNYPVAIKNCMDMVKVGCHLIIMTPTNNWFGHGFYQFSPDLFFSLLSEQNGFDETQIFIQDDALRWFKIRNPKDIKSRVNICIAENKPSILCVISKKIKPVPEKLQVLQNFWVDLWEKDDAVSSDKTDENNVVVKISFAKKIYRKFVRMFKKKKDKKKLLEERKKLFYEMVQFPNSNFDVKGQWLPDIGD